MGKARVNGSIAVPSPINLFQSLESQGWDQAGRGGSRCTLYVAHGVLLLPRGSSEWTPAQGPLSPFPLPSPTLSP